VLTNAGGLGEVIYAGIVQGRNTVLIAGSIMAAVLAWPRLRRGIVEEVLSPRGL
jgi:ABC-type proline/glycine betaine transport system permease subunit